MRFRHPLLPISLILSACQSPTAPVPNNEAAVDAVGGVHAVATDSLYDLIDLGPASRVFQSPELLLNNDDLLAINLLRPEGAHTEVWRLGQSPEMELLSAATTTARAINDRGEIVGGVLATNGRTHAFHWVNGILTDLGTLGGDQSEAFAISEDGVVVGEAARADGSTHAFRWEAGSMTDIGTLGGATSRATGVNDHGDITGYSTTGSLPALTRTFRWRHGRMVDLGPVRPKSSPSDNSPLDIAEDGTIIGQVVLPGVAGTIGGFRARRTALESLPPLTGRCCAIPVHVNSGRMIAGESYWLSAFDSPMGVVWRDGIPTDIGTLPFQRDSVECDYCVHQGVYVRDMNEAGQVVGRSTFSFGAQRAYVWADGSMRNLGTLGGLHSEALVINDHGIIAGLSTNSAHDLRWVVWRPRSATVFANARP